MREKSYVNERNLSRPSTLDCICRSFLVSPLLLARLNPFASQVTEIFNQKKKDKTDSSRLSFLLHEWTSSFTNEDNYLTLSFFPDRQWHGEKREREVGGGVSEFHKGHRENWNCVCATGTTGP